MLKGGGGGHKAIEANFLDIYISQEALHLHILNTDSVAVLELLASSFQEGTFLLGPPSTSLGERRTSRFKFLIESNV